MVGCWDFAFREPKPLRFLAGFPVPLLGVSVLCIGHLFAMRQFGFAGYLVHTVVAYSLMFIDGLASPALSANVTTLRHNGYGDTNILAITLFNSFGSQFLGFIVMGLVATQPLASVFIATISNPRALCVLVFRVFVNMALGDVLFWWSHRLMHRNERLAFLHRLHHCAKRASWSTNLLFHPIDLLIEFGGPVTVLPVTHFLLFDQDQLTLVATYMLLQVRNLAIDV